MQPPIIIGLAGRAGVGKDTVAEQLRDAGFIRFAFAEPLRQMLVAHLDLHGFNPYWINDRGFKETTLPVFGRSVRQHLQTMGAALRQDDPDYWVRCLALRAWSTAGSQPGTASSSAMCATATRRAGSAAAAAASCACCATSTPWLTMSPSARSTTWRPT
jgi:hypothetical protein